MQFRDDAHPGDIAPVAVRSTPRERPTRTPPGAGDRAPISLIVCAGMPRAGSTLQYNLIRLLAERHLGARAGGWDRTFDELAGVFPDYARRHTDCARPLVIKTHQYDPRYAALVDPPPRRSGPRGHVFCVYRDVRDALVSYTRQFGGTLDENIDRWTAPWIAWTERWCSMVHVTISRSR